ncbi:MAG: hypothetical protein ACLVAW_23185 [Eisenbergiella massiliensis]
MVTGTPRHNIFALIFIRLSHGISAQDCEPYAEQGPQDHLTTDTPKDWKIRLCQDIDRIQGETTEDGYPARLRRGVGAMKGRTHAPAETGRYYDQRQKIVTPEMPFLQEMILFS